MLKVLYCHFTNFLICTNPSLQYEVTTVEHGYFVMIKNVLPQTLHDALYQHLLSSQHRVSFFFFLY